MLAELEAYAAAADPTVRGALAILDDLELGPRVADALAGTPTR
jgi:hypothetical protein